MCTYMNVKTSEIFTKLLLPRGPNIFEILVAKHYHSSLGDQESKFVLLHIAQSRQLQSRNFCPNSWCKVCDSHIRIVQFEQMWFFLICIKAAVMKIKTLSRTESSCVVIDWEISCIFGL